MAVAIANDGVRLFWSMEGPSKAPVIVFGHSIGCGSPMWGPQLERLSGAFRILLHDTRGHGRSDAPIGDYDLSELASDIAAVMDAADLERAHVCGLSLGGAVAQRFALDRSDRVDRLILANTAARIGSAEGWTQRMQAVAAGGMEGIADMALSRFFGPDFARSFPETVEAVRSVFLKTSPHGYIGACAALRDADLTTEISRVTCPTLVIGGAGDVSTPPAQTEALARDVQDGRHILLNAAHLSNLEEPDAFTAAITEFLKD